ncbi:alpha/beta fold hydrolase [Novosphingobium percolationis]|uniref:alpha/beta fold hydrolase n=1 Tax=Novosphingobium percolationis TaxID=2871811 RepID=UPI001CD74047|nr:alpha/beta hydrolase [Novosphingobium percolationis]
MSGSPSSHTVFIDGRRLNVTTWGEESAPAVILIHGMRDHSRSWDRVAHALAAEYRVIVPDLRGHGDSDWADSDGYALSAYVADIADIAEALALKRYAIIGHSLGGAIGLRVASAYPDQVKVFIGIECIELPIQRDEAAQPTPYPVRLRQWIERRQAAAGRDMRHYATVDDASARMQREQPTLSPEIIGELARHAVAFDLGKGWRWKFDPRVKRRAPEDQHGTDLDQLLDAVACPVLLAYGDASWVPLPGPARLAHLKNHAISHFAGGSHWLHHEFHERFVSEALAFLHENRRTFQNA